MCVVVWIASMLFLTKVRIPSLLLPILSDRKHWYPLTLKDSFGCRLYATDMPVHGHQGNTRRWAWHATCLGTDLLRDPCRSAWGRQVLSYRVSPTWRLYKGIVYWEAMYWQGRQMHLFLFHPLLGYYAVETESGRWQAHNTQQTTHRFNKPVDTLSITRRPMYSAKMPIESIVILSELFSP